MDHLRENPQEWFSSHQLAAALGISIGSVTMSLKKLRKTDLVSYRKTGFRNGYEYRLD